MATRPAGAARSSRDEFVDAVIDMEDTMSEARDKDR
jgi:hypothetical protein